MHNREPISDACMFLLFLLLTPVSPLCRSGTPNECNNMEFVPGYNISSKGIDIVDLTMALYDWADANQWKTTNGGCTVCENPLLVNNPFQKLPLIITDWKANISCQDQVQHEVLQSVISVAEALTKMEVKNDWKNELDVKINSNAKIQWILAGSQTEETQICVGKDSEDKYIFLLHHITCSFYKFHISKNQSLNSHFQQSVRNLPGKYDSNSKIAYHDLISTYGTHFGTQMDLGVQLKYLTAIPVCKSVLEDIGIFELSRCLEIDLSIAFGLNGVTGSSDFQMCEEKKKNSNFLLLLSSERHEDRWGGSTSAKTPKEWLESAKSNPALLSYSLEPLHNLVAKGDTQREGLRQAVSEYVRNRALWRNCTHTCPLGSHPNTSEFCSCECPHDNFTNSMCCSQKRGLARLVVTIEHAVDLWGDYITFSDSYIAVVYQDKRRCTHTVWNNNNPEWNVNLNFGFVQLNEDVSTLRVEVWDEDFGWDDDRLGSCEVFLRSWTNEPQTCYLDHGRLYFKYLLTCGPNLGGYFCMDYISLWLNDGSGNVVNSGDVFNYK